MAQGQDEPLKLLLDVPESEALFGFDGYASTLASAILGTEPHFTIGIFGDWGRGKTTLLNKLQNELEDRAQGKVVTVFFDAWRYQREEHMLLPLLDTIYEHLKREAGHWKNLCNTLKRLSRSFLAATSISPVPQIGIDTGKGKEEWEKEGETRSLYYGWLNELQEALGEARKGDPERRIVVLIDDLDRCLPHKAVEVLESIKVMLDVTGFVFVLALNQEIVENAVEHHYTRDYGIRGRDYLKKLVQVEFRLPPLHPEDVVKYAVELQRRLGQTKGEAAEALALVVRSVAGHNPREVKRFINRALLSAALAQKAGLRVPVERQIFFFAADFRWPKFTEALSQDQAMFNQLKVYIEMLSNGREIAESEETRGARAVLEQNPGLERFLSTLAGSPLLHLNQDDVARLLFYSAITREEAASEPPERLNREELIDALRKGQLLTGTDLSGINLSAARLSGADLSATDLSRASLSRADLVRAILVRADLSGADLSGADLSKAILSRADLSGADLSGANLSKANLSEAILRGADLFRANFREARLDTVVLATLKDTNWRKAIWDEEVRKQLEEMFPEKR